MARLSLRQSIASQNLPGDGCASDSARNTGMEEEGRQPEIRQGKPISMSFPNWSIGAKLPPLREMWSEPSARKWPNLGNKTHRDGMAEGSSSQERTNSGHATRKHARGLHRIQPNPLATNGRPRNREFISLTERPRGMGMEHDEPVTGGRRSPEEASGEEAPPRCGNGKPLFSLFAMAQSTDGPRKAQQERSTRIRDK